jgi:uroporphyrinogen-III decarboxylase
MKSEMTSRERIVNALSYSEVDHVPMIINFWESPLHPRVAWKNERQRLELYRGKGWDTYVQITPKVTPDSSVRTNLRYDEQEGGQVLRQFWETPSGRISETLRVTEDWHEIHSRTTNLEFRDDFRTPRYLEFPFKTSSDLDALEYLFPLSNASDVETLVEEHREKKALSSEFGVPLFAYMDAGMDWLLWLFPSEEAVLRVVEDPGMIQRLLSHINAAKYKRLELLLDLGIDGVIRRGWYESTDLWSPEIFRNFAQPAVEAEIRGVHRAHIPYVYIMVTGIMPLLSDLASMPFDCLCGAEPVLGGLDLEKIRATLGGKSIWGGLSGPEDLGRGSPVAVDRSVDRAFSIFGKTGFILGMGVGFRCDWPWQNMEALEKAWRRRR